jgi:hypothetical protein
MGKTHRREKTFNEDFFFEINRPSSRSSRKKKINKERGSSSPSADYTDEEDYGFVEKFGKRK